MNCDCVITENEMRGFLTHLSEDEKSPATISKYIHDVRCFQCFLHDRVLTKELVLEYKRLLREEYAISSANSMLAALNAFFRFIGREHLCVKQYKVQKNIFCSADRELTKREYFHLVKAAKEMGDHRLSLLLQTVCGTGIRISELRYITVDAVREGKAVVSCKGKTRVIFIVSSLRKKLLHYMKKCGIRQGAIFVTRTGKILDRSNIWRAMKRLCEHAGIKRDKVFPHNLRHLFARTYYAKDKDITKLADVLGHTNVNTTRIYLTSTGEEHRKHMEQLYLVLEGETVW